MKRHTVSCMGIPFVIVEADVMPEGVVAILAPPFQEGESVEDWMRRCVAVKDSTASPLRAYFASQYHW